MNAGGAEPAALLDGQRLSLYGFFRRRGFSHDEAEDLTQETLIRGYGSLAGLRSAPASAWLRCIARNLAVDFRRRRRLPCVSLQELEACAPTDEDPAARLEHHERRAQLARAVDSLPDRYRRIVRLRFYAGCSVSEIADAMGCTPAAARVCLSRAVACIRKRGLPEL